MSATVAPVVYGTDDRRDYHETSTAMQTLTEQSIVALFRASRVDTSDPSNVQLTGATLAENYNLCADERFRDNPAGGNCSGTLIDDDLVLTAGHCFREADLEGSCRDTRFVFNYFYTSPGTLATVDEARDVYSCSRIVVRRLETTAAREQHDYAIVELDRPVDPSHVPAPLRAGSDPVTRGSAVTIIGFGSGIPAKIDEGGVVLNERAGTLDYFRATTDSFGGNSGSGVFTSTGELVGVLVRGQRDYIASGSCNIVNVLSDDQGADGGEQINYGFPAIDALCASGRPSARLCGTEASCGDGACTDGESNETCADDCPSPSCGDGTCDLDEDEASCASDCGSTDITVPGEWVCEPGYYGGLDGCDCECGAYDPDCDVLGQVLYGCETGQSCGGGGTCEGAPVSVPSGWTCPVEYFEGGDGCDCECGAYDPDCDDGSATTFGCADGQLCGADGTCEGAALPDAGSTPPPDGGSAGVDAGTTPPPSSGGCSSSSAQRSPAAPLVALLGMLLLGVVRRRR